MLWVLVHGAASLGAATLASVLHIGQGLQQLQERCKHIHGPVKTNLPIKTHI